MFIGREKELKKLNDMYSSNSFELAIIYGRRRIGKTTLIKEFCKDKKAIYFIAREANDVLNIENFSRDVFETTSKDVSGTVQFSNWEKAFEYIYEISKNERIILVIDEYPYLAQANASISSILQAHIDMKLKDSKLFLILCGSSMSFMENQVLGYKSPLYGRRTAQIRLRPFTFFESFKFHKGFTKEEKAIIYGITGGIPEYLTKVNETKTLRQNIIEMFLSDMGHLYEEPSSLLKQELREPAMYNSIITAIAKGASRLNEIATKNKIESNKCAKYLSSLISLGIVRKEKPVTEENSKKSIYVLEDNMFRFWYRFIPDNMTHIISENSYNLFDKNIKPKLSEYMGAVFEQICIQYLIKENLQNRLPFMFGKIGRWWGNNPKLKKQEEIDIIAVDNEDKMILGECKWKNGLVGENILESLLKKGEMFDHKEKYYYVFSKKGFTSKCIEKSKKLDKIRLVCFKDI